MKSSEFLMTTHLTTYLHATLKYFCSGILCISSISMLLFVWGTPSLSRLSSEVSQMEGSVEVKNVLSQHVGFVA